MENQKPDELGVKCEVGLLDNASGVQHPVYALTVYGFVLGNPPLRGLSRILLLLKMALLNNVTPILKLEG